MSVATLASADTVIRALSGWDYAVIAFYVGLIASIGILCGKLNKNPSDYFRGGGNMLWWVGAVSAMATGISTWTFTGGAAKCYQDGFVYPMTMVFGIIPSVILLWYVGPRFRRLRVITSMEAVFRRFGLGTEQFYTWFSLPMGLFWGGIGLNTLGVFMSAVFHLSIATTIISVGSLVTFLAVIGGQWALSFFAVVQGTILMLVSLMVAYLSVNRPEIGGISNLTTALPAHYTHFSVGTSGALVWIWIAWQVIFGLVGSLDLRNCGKFVRVKDDRSVRKMVIMMALPSAIFLMPVVIQLPSMCAGVLYPDMSRVFPQLEHPDEGAWLAMAFTVLPQGLLGLMVCAMFGAAADSADAALNSNAGFFVRNVYHRYINPQASDTRQIVVGKITTACFGIIAIVIGLLVNSLRSLNLFDLFQLLNAMLLPPMIVPMVLGMFVKRTPDWSGWSTVLAGLLGALVAKDLYTPGFIQGLLGLDRPLSVREMADSQFIFISGVTWGVSVAWFLGTMLFWRHAKPEHRARTEILFVDLRRPVDHLGEGGENQDAMQYRIIGLLSAIMGSMLVLCTAIPNPLYGRVCFLIMGFILLGMAYGFGRAYRRLINAETLP